jgi:Cu+-exporting ATPase
MGLFKRKQGAAGVTDPVCGMAFDPAKAGGGSVMHEGHTFTFCSTSCRDRFLANPSAFISAAPAPP